MEQRLGEKMFCDFREPKRLLGMLGDIGQVTELETGDYMFFASGDLSVVIERATIGDLLSKLTSGRLYDQLQRISAFDVAILLLEGVYSPGRDGKIRLPHGELGFRYEAVENLLLDAQLRGIILARTPSLEASARLIRGYYHYLTKEEHRFQVKKRRFFSFAGKVTPQMQLVCSLPGINYVLGQRLLDHFGVPLTVFQAEVEALAEVEGIGRGKAEAIHQVLRRGDAD